MTDVRDTRKMLTRAIAEALAEDRVRRHSEERPMADEEEERTIARHAARAALESLGSARGWTSSGHMAPLDG